MTMTDRWFKLLQAPCSIGMPVDEIGTKMWARQISERKNSLFIPVLCPITGSQPNISHGNYEIFILHYHSLQTIWYFDILWSVKQRKMVAFACHSRNRHCPTTYNVFWEQSSSSSFSLNSISNYEQNKCFLKKKKIQIRTCDWMTKSMHLKTKERSSVYWFGFCSILLHLPRYVGVHFKSNNESREKRANKSQFRKEMRKWKHSSTAIGCHSFLAFPFCIRWENVLATGQVSIDDINCTWLIQRNNVQGKGRGWKYEKPTIYSKPLYLSTMRLCSLELMLRTPFVGVASTRS